MADHELPPLRPRNPEMDAIVAGIHASPAFTVANAVKAVSAAMDKRRTPKASGPSNSAARYADWYDNYRDQQTFGEYLKDGTPEVDDECSSCIGTGIGDPHDERSYCWECKGSGINKPQPEQYE